MTKVKVFKWGVDDSRDILKLYNSQIENLHLLKSSDKEILDKLFFNEMNYMDRQSYGSI